VAVPVPRDLRPGRRVLILEGNGFALDQEEILIEVIEELARGMRQAFGRGGPVAGAAAAEPRTVKQLAVRVADLHQELGITARFRRRKPKVVLPSDEIRFGGRARLTVRVARPSP
jgi:hypothetical protein